MINKIISKIFYILLVVGSLILILSYIPATSNYIEMSIPLMYGLTYILLFMSSALAFGISKGTLGIRPFIFMKTIVIHEEDDSSGFWTIVILFMLFYLFFVIFGIIHNIDKITAMSPTEQTLYWIFIVFSVAMPCVSIYNRIKNTKNENVGK